MQMMQTRGGGSSNPGLGPGTSGGGAQWNEERAPSLPPPPPPPYTTDVIFTQFLGSQRNMEQMQRNMEEALRNIADNTHRGDNQGCNTLGVCHLLSTRFELKHDKLNGNKEVRVNL